MGLPEGAVDDYLAAALRRRPLRLRPAAGDRRGQPRMGRRRPAPRPPTRSSNGWRSIPPGGRAALPDLALVVFTGSGDAAQGDGRPAQGRPRLRRPCRAARRRRSANCCTSRTARGWPATWRRGCARARRSPPLTRRAKRSAGVADFDDLIRWTRAPARAAGHGRMGALQARPADRPYPGRRIAGHQPRPMGRSSRRWPAEYFSGSSEAERRHPDHVHGRRLQAGDLRLPGHRPAANSSAPREWVRDNAAALREAEDDSDDGERLALEFRDLSIDASFRSAPAVLDVVDAVIDEVGYRRDGPARAAQPPSRAFRPRVPGWSSCGSRSRSRPRRTATRARKAGSTRRDRALCRRARRAGPALARRSAGARLDQAAAERPATS